MVFRQSFDISFALDRVLFGAKIQQVTIMEIWALLTYIFESLRGEKEVPVFIDFIRFLFQTYAMSKCKVGTDSIYAGSTYLLGKHIS